MRERCLQHGLAVGPDGTCVLCRSRRPVTRKLHAALVVVALLAVVAGVVVWRTMRSTVNREALHVQSANTAYETNHAVTATTLSSTADSQSSSPTDRVEHIVLRERDPRGLAPELRARGELDVSGQYFAGQETFELFLPAAAVQGVPHGMLVWISSDPSGAIPVPEWRRALAAHHLIWVGPNRVGNDREIALRIGLALDCVRAGSAAAARFFAIALRGCEPSKSCGAHCNGYERGRDCTNRMRVRENRTWVAGVRHRSCPRQCPRISSTCRQSPGRARF